METIQDQTKRLVPLERAVFCDTLKAGAIVLATLIAKDLVGKTPQDAYRGYFLSTLGASVTLYQLSRLNQKVSKMRQVGEWMALYGMIDPDSPDKFIGEIQELPKRWKATLWWQKKVERDPLAEEVSKEFIEREGKIFEKHANLIGEVKVELKGGHKALLTSTIMSFREHRRALCHLVKWPYSKLAYDNLKRCEEAIQKQLTEIAKAPRIHHPSSPPPTQNFPQSLPPSEETTVPMPLPTPQDQFPSTKEPRWWKQIADWWYGDSRGPILPL